MNKQVPARCLRAIRNKDHIELVGEKLHVLSAAFEPPKNSRNVRVNNRHKSDHYETSVNWEDDLVDSFKQLTDNPNAKHGILSVRLSDLKDARKICPEFHWERDSQSDNRYHGNLLFAGETISSAYRRQIVGHVATCAQVGAKFIHSGDFTKELQGRKEISSKPLERLRALLRPLIDLIRTIPH
jgi:hypothetical protein